MLPSVIFAPSGESENRGTSTEKLKKKITSAKKSALIKIVAGPECPTPFRPNRSSLPLDSSLAHARKESKGAPVRRISQVGTRKNERKAFVSIAKGSRLFAPLSNVTPLSSQFIHIFFIHPFAQIVAREMSGQDGYFPPDDDASAGSAAAGAAATAARHSASPGSSETTADRIDRQVRLRHEMMVRVGLMPPPIGAIAAAAAAPRPVSPVSVHLQEPRNFELEEPGPLDNGDDDEVDREGDLFHLRRREDPYHGERAPASHASRTLSDGSNHLARPTARMGLSWPQPPQPVPLAERGVILPEQLFRDEPRFQDPPHPVIK